MPGRPGRPKLGGRDSIEAMETIETPEGAREGGLEAGEDIMRLLGVTVTSYVLLSIL